MNITITFISIHASLKANYKSIFKNIYRKVFIKSIKKFEIGIQRILK